MSRQKTFSLSKCLMRHFYIIILSSLFVLLLMGCHSTPENVAQKNELPDIYPDYVGVTIPVGIAPLNFSMADDEVETIDVEVKGSKGGACIPTVTMPTSISTSGTSCSSRTRVES